MPIAKTYKDCPIVSEPYQVYGRTYVNIEIKGKVKPVRFYNDAQWAEMNPESIKDRLGFTNGFIQLLICDAPEEFQQWLQANAQYSKIFGWFAPGGVELKLPMGMEAINLSWEEVSKENSLNSTVEIEMTVGRKRGEYRIQNVRYTNDDIGKKVKDYVLCISAIPLTTKYGPSTIYAFMASDGQGYEWITHSSSNIEPGHPYNLFGTIKAITPSRVKLTRCRVS